LDQANSKTLFSKTFKNLTDPKLNRLLHIWDYILLLFMSRILILIGEVLYHTYLASFGILMF